MRRSPLSFGLMAKRPVPDGRLAEVADSYTLIPQDQPEHCVRLIRAFIAQTPAPGP